MIEVSVTIRGVKYTIKFIKRVEQWNEKHVLTISTAGQYPIINISGIFYIVDFNRDKTNFLVQFETDLKLYISENIYTVLNEYDKVRDNFRR